MNLSSRCFILFGVLGGLLPPSSISGQRDNQKPKRNLMHVSVCEIRAKPDKYDNKIVRVRASVQINFEYSLLEDPHCSDGIWLVLGDGTGLPGPAMTVPKQSPKRTADFRRKAARIPIRLRRDAHYKDLERYLRLDAKGRSCIDNTPVSNLPDCRTYRVTATFMGRVDGVFRDAKSRHDAPTSQGFGHMGLFDAQLVVESVSEVSVEEIEH